MGRITEALNDITQQGQLSELYRLFKSINDYEIPIIRFTLYAGSSLIRQRINKKGQNFSLVSELSYPPVSLTKMERANLPGHPMFYACSFPQKVDDETPLPRMVSMLETSSFMKDKSAVGIERATVSRWLIKNDLELIALPFLGTYDKASLDLIDVKEKWDKEIKMTPIPEDPLELVNYMAEEISKEFSDKDQYFKIANFVNYLLTINKKTCDADGIVYPSVPAEGAGFNVAIKPEVVESKLEFLNASVCHYLKRGKEATVFSISDACVDGFKNLTFKNRIFSDKEKEFYDIKMPGYLSLTKPSSPFFVCSSCPKQTINYFPNAASV